jgi:hypothetical protein
MEPFEPDAEEYIARFPVDDDLVLPPPEKLVHRDVYDPATQDIIITRRECLVETH